MTVPPPIKMLDVDLCWAPSTLEWPAGYPSLQALVRFRGRPLGYVTLSSSQVRAPWPSLRQAILDRHGPSVIRQALRDALGTPGGKITLEEMLGAPRHGSRGPLPRVTVAVCTRDRTESLATCLRSIECLDYATVDLLVVDNAPITDATEQLVRRCHPRVRYVREPRPGLNWARNRAIAEARGEIIAYTDDDVVVDPGWVGALARLFVENPGVMAVTGLVIPYELETPAQILFEQQGGFGRGFERRWYRATGARGERIAALHGGAGKFGTGANMAYRVNLFQHIGVFDPALDVGTVTNGGGDLDMFFRVLKEGHTLVYEPEAIVRHRHRQSYEALRTQLTNHGIGFYSYLVRSAQAYPDERMAFIRMGMWWLWWWNLRRLLISFIRPGLFPRDLILAELRGSLIGLIRYQKARRTAARIARHSASEPAVWAGETGSS